MAEPVSALPVSGTTEPLVRNEPVPWPNPPASVPVSAEPAMPEMSDRNSRTAMNSFSAKVRTGFAQSYDKARSTMSEVLQRSAARFRYMSQERPMQIVLGVALAAFIGGTALRIWRSSHD